MKTNHSFTSVCRLVHECEGRIECAVRSLPPAAINVLRAPSSFFDSVATVFTLYSPPMIIREIPTNFNEETKGRESDKEPDGQI